MKNLKSKVYFIPTDESDQAEVIESKLKRLIQASRLLDCIDKGDKTAIKIHFGEQENTGFVKPRYARLIYDALLQRGASAFFSDTNALYRGGRNTPQEHLQLAYEHGFTPEIVAGPLVIVDDTKKENVSSVEINQRFVKTAKIVKLFLEADAIVDVSHFKGHMMSGFGGALKNIGMGCAAREGKLEQHCDVAPVLDKESCIGCGVCVENCPVEAITIKNEKAELNQKRCIGCASCIACCPNKAFDVDWESGADLLQEKMVEYTQAVLKGKVKKRIFFNFAIKVTRECDCLAKDDPRIAPDIGIFASDDPVAIDQACMDSVNQTCGRDIFQEVHPRRDGRKQLAYARRLGLGNLDYELIKIKGA
jgi:uncharacterized Fe-S center protein